jgi:hypothetical protein
MFLWDKDRNKSSVIELGNMRRKLFLKKRGKECKKGEISLCK